MPNPLDYRPPEQRDDIEREPPNWYMLPVIAGGVIVVFFVIVPLILRLLRR